MMAIVPTLIATTSAATKEVYAKHAARTGNQTIRIAPPRLAVVMLLLFRHLPSAARVCRVT